MDRRQFIAATATVGLAGGAGCVAVEEDTKSENGAGSRDSTDSGQDTGDRGLGSFDPPDARFSIDVPNLDEPRTHTVLHESGESIEARELFVRGEGIADGYTGAFHEITGSGFGPDDDVSPGDTVVVIVQDEDAAHEISVVWESADSGDYMVYTQVSVGEARTE